MGFKFFKHYLYERQLKFFFRLMNQDKNRWSYLALMDHMSNPTESKYYKYICNIRTEMKIGMPVTIKNLSLDITSYFLQTLNGKLNELSLQGVSNQESFIPAMHLSEHESAQYISKFRLGMAGLGNNIPRQGYPRVRQCTLCAGSQPNSEYHIFIKCNSLKEVRLQTGIQHYINKASIGGVSDADIFKNFLAGKETNGEDSVLNDVLKDRGNSLKLLCDRYLSLC